jgi:hypothetical protein
MTLNIYVHYNAVQEVTADKQCQEFMDLHYNSKTQILIRNENCTHGCLLAVHLRNILVQIRFFL